MCWGCFGVSGKAMGRNVTREVAGYVWKQALLPGIFNQRLYVIDVTSRKLQWVSIPDYDASFFISINPFQAACISVKGDEYTTFLVEYSSLVLTDLDLNLTHNHIDLVSGCYIQQSLCLVIPYYARLSELQYLICRYSFPRSEWDLPSNKSISRFIQFAVPYTNLVYMLLGSSVGRI